MSQIEKANAFAALHKKGAPVVLYNIWDAGGAKALVKAGAPAVATGSWALAAAHGFDDGEAIPLDLMLTIVARICATVDVPVTVDFEGGYASEPQDVAENVRKVIRSGAIGINFEDRVVKGEGLYPITTQVERISAIKTMAAEQGVPLVLNARTDLFLGSDPATHTDLVAEAKEREQAYFEAGADCFFVPGLTATALISEIIDAARLPINVMMMGALETVDQVAALGVSRASYGPAPFIGALEDLRRRYAKV